MSGVSEGVGSFTVVDYLVFAVMLAVSAAIGVYYAFVNRRRGNTGEFLTGGRGMSALPVSLSLTASFMSAITMLSNPAEVYRYGICFIYFGIAHVVMVVVTSEIFVPFFYRISITSTYEYLEMRFNRATRLLGTVFFVVQTIFYTGFVIYIPALALNHVTGMNLWGAIISTGVVCTFYCSVGGLKAVVWTDVFQLGVMLAGLLAIIIRSVVVQGGVMPIIADSQEGGRLHFHEFDLSPLRRHTFWTTTIGGSFLWITIFGINQSQVQRYLSCKTMSHARFSLYINLLGLWFILICSVFAGLCLYSIYKSCDPWTTGRISAPDQLVPYLVMDIFRDYPGLPGLFVAAAYSGSLSTVSSSINALATVTVEDFIKPYTNMSEKYLFWTAKLMSLLYGVLCIAMSAVASVMGGVLQAALSISGIIGGPLLGLFTMGILFPFANSKGAISGVVSGLAVALWVGIGAQIYPPSPELTQALPLNTSGCNFTTTGGSNWTTSSPPVMLSSAAAATDSNLTHFLTDWYSLSYLYFSPLGTITTISVGLLVSVFTGGWNLQLESSLMLQKEDTLTYYFFKSLKNKISSRRRKHNLTNDGQKNFDGANPAFCDIELDAKYHGTLK
ncbi:unnamed protein product [Ophioblennius macclurei]